MSSGDTLAGLVSRGAWAADIAAHLGGLPHHERVRQCLAFPGRLQPKLYETVKGTGTLAVETFLPVTGRTAVYELRNSLVVFPVSQKRFFRPAEGEAVGYNHTPRALAQLAGPGYFHVAAGSDGAMVFDYTRRASLRPTGWPPLRSNRGIVSGAVYGNVIHYVWPVGPHTAIGEAYRNGRSRRFWCLLTRAASES